ncbi:MAG: hypothetical protein ABSF22_24325 [Bryobacteraceae bacterium]
MSEMDPRQAEMDRLLRRSMSAPVPRLTPGFDERLSRELRRRSEPANQYGRILLAGYALISAATSILVMRGQGLHWGMIAAMTMGPLALVEAARRLRRRQRN